MKVFKCHASLVFLLGGGDINRIPFEFGNLEEIEFSRRHLNEHWTNILMQNKKLRIVTARNALQREHLERIADGLTNLEEFTMEYFYRDATSVRDIVNLFQNAKQMKKISFSQVEKNECDEAAHQLSNDWENMQNKFICCFVRKEF